jgi:hypothetical protein|tara:strand:- start:45 stop:395 length:351 start_codon:yes stop_codon:yes gene_type:complete
MGNFLKPITMRVRDARNGISMPKGMEISMNADGSGGAVPEVNPSPAKRTKAYKAGMSAAERKAYNNKTGGNLQAPQPEGGARKVNYCARSAGIKKCKDPDKNGDCPNDIARRNWKC